MNDDHRSSASRWRLGVAGTIGFAVLVALIWPATRGYRAVGSISVQIVCDETIQDDVRVSYGFVPERFIAEVIEARKQRLPGEYRLDKIDRTEETFASLTVCEVGYFGKPENHVTQRYPESETVLVEFTRTDGHREYQTVRIPWQASERPLKIVLSMPSRQP
jgi:hypothetical protein